MTLTRYTMKTKRSKPSRSQCGELAIPWILFIVKVNTGSRINSQFPSQLKHTKIRVYRYYNQAKCF